MTAQSEVPARVTRLAPGPTTRFLLAFGAYLIAFWSIYLGFVATTVGQRVENAALLASTLRTDADRADSLSYLSQVSAASFIGAMALVALVGLLRRRPGLGVLAVVVMASSALIAEILKVVLPRPGLLDGPAWLLRNSFPSGTTTVAASVAVGVLLVAPDRLRWLVLPIAAAGTAIVGQATQVTGWHRASDALGGVVLAALVGTAALVILARIGHVRPSSVGRVHPRVFTLIGVLAGGAVLLGIALVAVLAAFPLLRAPTDAEGAFLHTASDIVVFGLSMVAIAGFTWLIEPYTLGASPLPGAELPPIPTSDVAPAADGGSHDATPDATPDDPYLALSTEEHRDQD